MATRAQVPVLLLTGFPGSGRTGLLAHWLTPEFFGAMTIVNEPGEVGAKPPRAVLTNITQKNSADEVARFIAARIAISDIRAATHSTGARA